jgi:tellurite resistance protein
MGIFSFGKSKVKEAANQFTGNKDFLEGLCAACALTAAADGQIDDSEYDKALEIIRSNTAISAGFDSSEIEKTFGRMAPKTKSRMGKSELKDEIRQVIARDKTGKLGEAIILTALDVADTGGISPEETAIMKDIAQIAGVNYDKLLNS